MFFILGQALEGFFGPFRLFTSRLFLIASGTSMSFLLTFILLPAMFKVLPTDRGRSFAVESQASKGKPTGAGVVFISVFAVVAVLVVPWGWRHVSIIGLTVLAMISGFLDDRSQHPWGEYLKGVVDLIISLAAAFVLYYQTSSAWLPFTTVQFPVSIYVFVPIATILIWITINSTNCTDGVDGLSSTLVMIALLSLGAFLYLVVGNIDISSYMLVPFYDESANWAIMVFTLVGALAAYLWYNAHPSMVLMGDAGSRALGFVLGAVIVLTGNPFMILISSAVILVNGGTGLIKVALLRFARIRILHTVRFPLHDHFRHSMKWSNSQVLIRFALIQILLVIVLFGIFINVR